jgi:hypothetical protein
VQPDPTNGTSDFRWVGPRLVDGGHGGNHPQRIGSGAEPDGISDSEPELRGDAPLHGDARHLDWRLDDRCEQQEGLDHTGN